MKQHSAKGKTNYRKKFDNTNVEIWFRWIFRKDDELSNVTVYFLSKRNSTSARFFPLYNNSNAVRIVLIRGLNIPKTDRVVLWLTQAFVLLYHKKFSRYKVFIDNGFKHANRVITDKVIQLDDPEFSKRELDFVASAVKHSTKFGKRVWLMVTTDDIALWFATSFPLENIFVLPQGFTQHDENFVKNEKMSLVYSSPYIHSTGDKFVSHPSWGSSHLICDLIPKILSRYPTFEIHLIGALGEGAKNEILRYGSSQVVSHGLVSPAENARLIGKCHIGLYPRQIDQGRQVLKTMEYLGAKLPVVTYRHVDTEIVEKLEVGVAVDSEDEFVHAISIVQNEYNSFVERVNVAIREGKLKSWVQLGKDFDVFLNRLSL